MKNFIGVKIVKAEVCQAWKRCGEYHKGDGGYKVTYKDGYTSWCPTKVFESNNFSIEKPDTISKEEIKNMIHKTQTTVMSDKTTIVHVTLINGFTLTEENSCIDPVNYDEQISVDLCMDKITDKIQFLLEFLLQSAQSGFTPKEFK